LTKEQQGTRVFQSPEGQPQQQRPIQEAVGHKKQPPAFEYELDLIRLMLLFGTREIVIADESEEKQATSVIELIYDELIQDDLIFENPLCKMIFEEFERNLKNKILLSTSYFKNLENQKIVSFVSHLQSSDIELSYNWVDKYNIVTKSEGDDIYKSVMNSIYNFKYHKVDEVILNIKSRIKSSSGKNEDMLDLLAEQMSYEKIKKSLSDKLGRIIIK
jgi:hypothetical protein